MPAPLLGLFAKGAAKSMTKGMAKSAARQFKREAYTMAKNLRREAPGMIYDYTNRARAAATNYVDRNRNRIYQTGGNAFYTHTGNGRNYNPHPVYYNRPGSDSYQPLT
jgi:hypothetical protein